MSQTQQPLTPDQQRIADQQLAASTGRDRSYAKDPAPAPATQDEPATVDSRSAHGENATYHRDPVTDDVVEDPQVETADVKEARARTPASNPTPISPELRAARAATSAASRAHPSAPQSPTDARNPPLDATHRADASKGLLAGIDARLHMATDLAKRGLAYASTNDIAKALLLLLDMHHTPNAADSKLAQDAAAGRAPPLL